MTNENKDTDLLKYVHSILVKSYPDYKQNPYLPPDLLVLCVSYNADIRLGDVSDQRYIKNGRYMIQFYNGMYHGITQKWDNNRPMYYQEYRYALPHGIMKVWYRNGELKNQCEYRNGVRHGDDRSWYPSGSLVSTCYYINGKKHGRLERWWENGNIHSRLFYERGKKIGKKEMWYRTGELYSRSFYEKGKIKSSLEWHQNGQLCNKIVFKDGVRDGESEGWWENGVRRYREIYVDGRKIIYDHWLCNGYLDYKEVVDANSKVIEKLWTGGKVRETWNNDGTIITEQWDKNGTLKSRFKCRLCGKSY